ncbi:hypothetical protein [Gallaecimonas pentaromativorans]|uniref:hypothetical protein n=1 Tax=Gallaecimonas pentaromativorans TaxID=584787 RepID=UPI003A8D86ED
MHEDFDNRFSKIRYSAEKEDFSPNGLDVVPLLETDLTITGFFIDENEKPNFIQFDIEDPDDYENIGNTKEDLINFLVEEYVDHKNENLVRSLLFEN